MSGAEAREDGAKTETVIARVPPALKAAVRAEARRRGLGTSEAVRLALAAWVGKGR